MFSQVPLRGCHQSLMPSCRVPQTAFKITVLDEVGMAGGEQRTEALTFPMRWCTGDEGDHVVGVAHANSLSWRMGAEATEMNSLLASRAIQLMLIMSR